MSVVLERTMPLEFIPPATAYGSHTDRLGRDYGFHFYVGKELYGGREDLARPLVEHHKRIYGTVEAQYLERRFNNDIDGANYIGIMEHNGFLMASIMGEEAPLTSALLVEGVPIGEQRPRHMVYNTHRLVEEKFQGAGVGGTYLPMRVFEYYQRVGNPVDAMMGASRNPLIHASMHETEVWNSAFGVFYRFPRSGYGQNYLQALIKWREFDNPEKNGGLVRSDADLAKGIIKDKYREPLRSYNPDNLDMSNPNVRIAVEALKELGITETDALVYLVTRRRHPMLEKDFRLRIPGISDTDKT